MEVQVTATSAYYALWIVSVPHLRISNTSGNKIVLDLHAIRNTKHAPTQAAAEVLAPLAVRWCHWLEFHLATKNNSATAAANYACRTLCVCHLPNNGRGGTKTIHYRAIRTTKHRPSLVGAACGCAALLATPPNACCGVPLNTCASPTATHKFSGHMQGNASSRHL